MESARELLGHFFSGKSHDNPHPTQGEAEGSCKDSYLLKSPSVPSVVPCRSDGTRGPSRSFIDIIFHIHTRKVSVQKRMTDAAVNLLICSLVLTNYTLLGQLTASLTPVVASTTAELAVPGSIPRSGIKCYWVFLIGITQ